MHHYNKAVQAGDTSIIFLFHGFPDTSFTLVLNSSYFCMHLAY